jgi:hypothetical protein
VNWLRLEARTLPGDLSVVIEQFPEVHLRLAQAFACRCSFGPQAIQVSR